MAVGVAGAVVGAAVGSAGGLAGGSEVQAAARPDSRRLRNVHR